MASNIKMSILPFFIRSYQNRKLQNEIAFKKSILTFNKKVCFCSVSNKPNIFLFDFDFLTLTPLINGAEIRKWSVTLNLTDSHQNIERNTEELTNSYSTTLKKC